MGFLKGKQILITGVISNRSIAYGIAKACYAQEANLAFTYANVKFKERIIKIAKEFNSNIVLLCDVRDDKYIENTFLELGKFWKNLDGLVHSIGFAPREAISGNFLDGLTRENFHITHDISAYSFSAMARIAFPFMKKRNSSLLTLSYLGSERVIDNYNIMGLAKASLESSVRYLANDLGQENIRVNGISAGPIRTLAASGIKDFLEILKFVKRNSLLRRNVTIEDIGNTAAFLLSDLSSGITGEIIHVDAGFSNVIGNK